MKLLHFADLHIGVENHGRTNPTTGWSTRLHDFLDAFDELVDAAIAEQVDIVLFAGDAYKARNPDQTHQREFAKRVYALAKAGIPVYLVVGNHDVPTMLTRASALDIFSTLEVERVHIGGKPEMKVIETRSGPLQVVGMPWPNVTQLLRQEQNRSLSIQQLDEKLEQTVANVIATEAEKLDPALPAVLVAHVAMSDSTVKTASEKAMTVGRFAQLNRSDLSPQCFDYVALGHHHYRQILHEHPPIAYAGSLQRVDFGEENDPKGYYLINLDPTKPLGERVTKDDVVFREVNARRFITFDIEPKTDDPTAEVLAKIAAADVREAIVRVLLKVSADQNAKLDEKAIREALSGAHHLASVSRNVDRGVRSRLGADVLPESLTPLDAVGIWLRQTRVAADLLPELLRHAKSVIDDVPVEEIGAVVPPLLNEVDSASAHSQQDEVGAVSGLTNGSAESHSPLPILRVGVNPSSVEGESASATVAGEDGETEREAPPPVAAAPARRRRKNAKQQDDAPFVDAPDAPAL